MDQFSKNQDSMSDIFCSHELIYHVGIGAEESDYFCSSLFLDISMSAISLNELCECH